MTHRTVPRGAAVVVFVLLTFLPMVSQALLFRAYLAPGGSDSNPCTLVQPCRLLPAALSAVADGGEIWILDSANYNTSTVDVTKSVTILAVPGVVGSVVSTGGAAISIATADVSVTLRNLVIVPVPGSVGTSGIQMSNGFSLTVAQCLVASMTESGIHVNTPALVTVTDTTILGNGTSGLFVEGGAHAVVAGATISLNGSTGIAVRGAASTTTAEVSNTMLGGNLVGFWVTPFGASTSAKATLRSSQVVASTNDAIGVETGASGQSLFLAATDNVVSNNGGAGIFVGGTGAKVWASGNVVSGNTYGLWQDPGSVFESAGDNAVRNNLTNKFGTISVVSKR